MQPLEDDEDLVGELGVDADAVVGDREHPPRPAVLTRGVGAYLDYLKKNDDPATHVRLADELDQSITRSEAERFLFIILQAIRENDFRAEALGYRTVTYRTVANCLPAAMAVVVPAPVAAVADRRTPARRSQLLSSWRYLGRDWPGRHRAGSP